MGLGVRPFAAQRSAHHLRRGRLVGWVAPLACTAVGVIAQGRAHALEATTGSAATIRLCCLVGREGQVAAQTVFPDATVVSEPPGGGFLLDILLRALRLSTDPPDEGSERFLSALWLHRVLDTATPQRRLEWPDLIRLHPGVARHSEDISLQSWRAPERLVHAAGRAWTWPRLRGLAISGMLSIDNELTRAHDPRQVAAWLDVGSFARWARRDQLPMESLLRGVAPLVTREALSQARRLLVETGVLASRR
jgi:hypothetical protein